jgi:hypothetical protein
VSLGSPDASRGLVIGARAISTATYTDSTGIAVQTAPLGLTWQTVALIHPRRETDRIAIAVPSGQQVRLVFYGDYEVSGLRGLSIEATVTPTSLTLASAQHSRGGDVASAVSGQDEQSVALAFGDTLALRYAVAAPSDGQVRDLFLSARARNLWSDSPDSLQSARATTRTDQTWSFALGQARPNPSAREFSIDYTLARAIPVSIRVYDVAGRLVRTLVNENREAGPHSTVWDGRNDDGRRVSASVYFYRMVAGSFTSQRKAVLLTR